MSQGGRIVTGGMPIDIPGSEGGFFLPTIVAEAQNSFDMMVIYPSFFIFV